MADTTNKKTCRRCDKILTKKNARMWQNRFIGACRVCESHEARERYERSHPGATHYEDSRRKYEIA